MRDAIACLLPACLDIDKFKNINDTLGHLAGDEVLRNVARLVKSQLRTNDVVARYGGEEFVVLLPQTAPRQACEVAERVRSTIAAQSLQPLPGERLAVTISIGVAMMPGNPSEDDGASAQQLVSSADAALYRAKESGRNRVVCAEGGSLAACVD